MNNNSLDLLVDIPLFDDLRPEELNQVNRYISVHNLKHGEVLFKEGEKSDYVCFIAKGAIEVSKDNDGKQAVLAKVPAGRMVGEMSLFDHQPRSATATALKASSVVILSKENAEQLFSDHPKAGIKILKEIARIMSLNLRRTSLYVLEQ